MKKRLISLLALSIMGCSTPIINTSQDFSDLEKEYKSFSTKALSDAYVKRMFTKYLSPVNQIQLTRQLEFSRYLKTNNDTSYETSLKSMFSQTPSLYDQMTGVSAPDIQNKMSTESATFGSYVIGLSPYPAIPVAASATNITLSGFTANWSAITGATYDLVVTKLSDSSIVFNQNIGSVITYPVTGLSGSTAYTWKVRANKGALISPYTSNQNVTTASGLVLNLDAGDTSSYPGTGTAWTDLSGNGNNGTLMNGPIFNSADGGSIVFDGVNDYTNIPDNDNFNFGSGLWTVEAWIKTSTSRVSGNSPVLNQSIYGATSNSSFFLGAGTNIGLYLTNASGSWDTSLIGGSNVNNNKWRHIVWTRDSSTSLKIYLDGVMVASKNDLSPTYTMNNSSRNIEVGIQNNNSTVSFSGNISNIRVYKGLSLTPAEILQNYNALKLRDTGLVFNLDAGNSSSYPGTGTIWTDLSGNGNNGTLVNGVGYSSANSGSLVFDGIDDYVVRNVSPLAQWTVTCFFKSNSASGNYKGLVEFSTNTTNRSGIGIDVSGKPMIVYPTSKFNVSTGNTVDNNSWHFLAGTYDGTTPKLYLNGVLQGLGSNSSAGNPNITGKIVIGQYTYLIPGYYLKGNISTVQLYNRVLTDTEVLENYNTLKVRYGL